MSFPPWRAYGMEVRCPPPPPTKGVSQRYLRDTLGNKSKCVRYPPLRYYLERVLRNMWGHLALRAAKVIDLRIIDRFRGVWEIWICCGAGWC